MAPPSFSCPTCGAGMEPDTRFCAACGSPRPPQGDQPPADRRLAVGLDFGSRVSAETTPSASLSSAVLSAAADPTANRANPLTLRFSSTVLESAFNTEFHGVRLRYSRFVTVLALVLVVAFGVLDAIIQPTVVRQLWIIRYGIITPFLIGLWIATYVPALRPHLEWGLMGIVLVAGGGILAMILISPPPGSYFYYAGLILVIMYNFTFLRLRFWVANVAGWSLVLSYLGAELVIGRTPWQVLVNNMFFFGSANIIGMFAAYFLESLARRNFLQDKLVRRAREFGSYRLAAKLGEGGMGEVWRAEHRLLARPAAIKLIRPEMLGGGDNDTRHALLQRFEREAQATALLRSPHTVEVYDFGVTDDGIFYYVMELLRGYDLQTMVRTFGALPPGRAVRFLRQACDSLAEAHQEGLIHRDIKPANIHVCQYGREVDFVKLLDFGIVKWNRRASMRDLDITQQEFAGTPSCMAPEQISGDRPIDGRADLYSLGCVGYWMLTGRHVFEAETVVQVLARHLDATPTPPSQHCPGEIPSDLEAVIMACLEKNPARRPSTADALVAMLASYPANDWSDGQARQWWVAHPPVDDAGDRPDEERTIVPSMLYSPRP